MRTHHEALALLRGCDHAFLFDEEATIIAAPFGVTPWLYEAVVDPSAFKGLSVPGKDKGDVVLGVGAHDLANQIARHLDPDFGNPMQGRGSALRWACDAIERWIQKRQASPTVSPSPAP